MFNTPGQDDEDGELELSFDGLDDDPEVPLEGSETTTLPAEPDGVAPSPPVPAPSAATAVDEDDCIPLDEAKEQVGYELFDWAPAELDALDDRLHLLGLPHEWVSDGHECVVHIEDEDTVDAVLPTIRFPDELEAEEDDGDDTDITVLGELFVAADRMQKDPSGDAVSAFLDAAERIEDKPPYGVDVSQWGRVVDVVDELIDLFQAAGPAHAISTLATQLREHLRPLV